MSIFNQTFGQGQNVIYPQGWNRGQTLIERFQQTKKGLPWLVVSKIMQLIVAFLWILLIFTMLKGLFQLWKISRLPSDSPKRKAYGKVLTCQSIASMLAISISLLTLSLIVFIREQWIRSNLIQAFAIWIVVLVVKRVVDMIKNRK